MKEKKPFLLNMQQSNNPSTKRIKISRDVSWMGKFYNDGHPIEILEYKENNSRSTKSISPPIRYDMRN